MWVEIFIRETHRFLCSSLSRQQESCVLKKGLLRIKGSKECDEIVDAAKYIFLPRFASHVMWFTDIDRLAERINCLHFYCTIKCICHEINWEWDKRLREEQSYCTGLLIIHPQGSRVALTASHASIFLTFLTASPPFMACPQWASGAR